MVSRLIFVFFTIFVAVSVQSATREEQIAERLKPVGEVQMAAAVPVASGPQDPETVYNTYCVACHAAGVANAPILGDAAAWSERLAKGMDVLYSSGINGLGALMPARGMCASCTDEELNATVDYMLEKSQ